MLDKKFRDIGIITVTTITAVIGYMVGECIGRDILRVYYFVKKKRV